ncbi:MAG TPA: thioesterase, partial [Flavobacterium sp.]|nr:thioesterase [Flavobacterium sp.]
VLVMQEIKKYDLKISMLVLNSTAHFSKKANGRIVFSCTEGEKIREVVKSVVKTNESKTIWLSSTGRDKMGDEVAQLKFEWTMKVK